MSAIFLSHSSRDVAAAEAMQAWLQARSHQSIFLDFDPANGIPAGRDWEQELYRRLRVCRAVIVLLSEHWLASRWCFAEVTQARALGKAIFPVRVAECGDAGVLGDVQQIDLTRDPEDGYRRLAVGLEKAGLDPRAMFDWDPHRPPYPGLLALQEQDAAVFFGRDEDIGAGLDTLNRLRRMAGARLTLFLGASGSGKSSLVRAGLLPRLERDADNWLPVPPFRPQERPLDELALALADRFARIGQARDWQEIRAALRRGADADPVDGMALVDLARDLQIAAGRREATVLLTIDQAEELFGYGPGSEAQRFARLLRTALEAGGARLMALATMRSDFLDRFQTDPGLRDLDYETVTVDPLSARHLPEIIEGPAEVAAIALGPGLVAAIVADTETEDALPLLAFTLRELHERYGGDGRLALGDYRDLGGLEGSVRRAADGVIDAVRPDEVELGALRSAFVPAMVRINEQGQYTRRRAFRSALPAPAQPLLQRFVDARLLVSDRDKEGQETLEVAHEALLRAWPRLRVWLDEDQDKLRLRETIRRAAEAWQERAGDDDWLDHRGSRLEAAEALVAEDRFALTDASERDYLEACLERRRREEEAARALREREARAERDRLRRARLFAGVTSVLFAIAAGIGWFAWQQWGAAEIALAKEQSANSRRLATASVEQTNAGSADLGILIALEALATADTDEAKAALEKAVFRLHEPLVLPVLDEVVLGVEFSPDGQSVATASADGIARLWDTASGQVLMDFPGHEALIYAAGFSPDGARLVTASGDGTARLWDAKTGKVETLLSDHGRDVYVATFSPDGGHLVSASDDGTARIWELDSGKSIVLEGHETWLNDAAFRPDSARVVTAAADGTARIWDAATGAELLVLRGHLDSVNSVRFSPDGARVVTASDDDTARLWDAASGADMGLLQGHAGYVLTARFSPDGERIVTASADGTARIWDGAAGASQVVLRGHGKEVLSAAFSPDGQLVVTASADGFAGVWNAENGASLAVLAGHVGPVRQARFSPDGQRVATASDDGTARLWWTRRFTSFDELRDVAADLPGRSLTPDERLALSLE